MSQGSASAVAPRPAHGMGVVHVQIELGVTLQHVLEPLERREIAEHRIDSVAEVPDAFEPVARVDQPLLQLVEPAVSQ